MIQTWIPSEIRAIITLLLIYYVITTLRKFKKSLNLTQLSQYTR